MMKLPGHVPQDIVFVWSCSEFLSVTCLTMLCFKFTSWGRRTINSPCLLCFLPTHTHAHAHAHTHTHTPLIFSPFQMFSRLALPDHQVSGTGLVAHQRWSTEVPPSTPHHLCRSLSCTSSMQPKTRILLQGFRKPTLGHFSADDIVIVCLDRTR